MKIEEKTPRSPRVWLETAEDGSQAAFCTMYPDIPEAVQHSTSPVEIVFLIDR